MSLNKFTDATVPHPWMNINCNSISVNGNPVVKSSAVATGPKPTATGIIAINITPSQFFGNGSLVIPVSQLRRGSTFKITGNATYTTTGVASNIQLILYNDALQVQQLTNNVGLSLPGSQASAPLAFEFIFTIRAINEGFIADASSSYGKISATETSVALTPGAFIDQDFNNNTTVDYSNGLNLNLFAVWSVVGQSLTLQSLVLEQLY